MIFYYFHVVNNWACLCLGQIIKSVIYVKINCELILIILNSVSTIRVNPTEKTVCFLYELTYIELEWCSMNGSLWEARVAEWWEQRPVTSVVPGSILVRVSYVIWVSEFRSLPCFEGFSGFIPVFPPSVKNETFPSRCAPLSTVYVGRM